jgi:serine protease Do
LSFQEIYQKVIPSVVSITSTLSGGTATGTGIVMSEDGYIITNYHVIDGAEHLTVLLHDDTEYVAALVGGDETSDLAVLKIDAKGLDAAEFGSSASLQVGDEVVAIGDPLGTELRGTMTNGIISAINRDLQVDERTMTLIQTNAALNSGNSGGPLINCYGQVIGINTMKMSSYYSSIEGLGFAIPISNAKPIIDELIEKGYVSGRPAIGIRIAQDVNNAARAYYNIPEGIIVQSVTSGSDAAAKGLQAGDVIIAFEGTTVTTTDELRNLLSAYTAGETVRMTIWRNGETFDISIVLMDAHDNT